MVLECGTGLKETATWVSGNVERLMDLVCMSG